MLNLKRVILFLNNYCAQSIFLVVLISTSVHASDGPKSTRNDTTGPQEAESVQHGENSTLYWKENWTNHTQNLTRQYYDPHVVIYTDPKLSLSFEPKEGVITGNATWLFNFTSQVWSYMTGVYGNFSDEPTRLFLLVHQGRYNKPYREYVTDPRNRRKINKRNILDISSAHPNAWLTTENNSRTDEMDYIINNLAYFVDKSFKGGHGSPTTSLWRVWNVEEGRYVHTAWVDIFTLDVYTSLNFTENALRYREKIEGKFDSNLGNSTFWMRDWFLPIYEKYGGNRALRDYFQLLRDNVSPAAYFNQSLNLGEFVHFWSGAAQTDLKPMAEKAFAWNETYDEQYNVSRMNYPNVTERIIYVYLTEKVYVNITQDKVVKVQDNTSTMYVVAASVSILFVVLLILFVSIRFYKRKIKFLKTEIRELTSEEVNEFFEGDGNANMMADEAQAMVLSMPFIKDYEIPRDLMVLDPTKILGTGEFGTVLHGFIRHSENDPLVTVAMKIVKPNVDVVYFKAFLSEVKIMAYLGTHENIVGLLGTCTTNIQNREIFLALEFCALGNLESYLQKNRNNFEILATTNCRISSCDLLMQTMNDNTVSHYWKAETPNVVTRTTKQGSNTDATNTKITILDLLKWSYETSNAMLYLTDKKVIHGDLAARNILLTGDRVAKVGDFGLSRQFLNYANYMKTSKLPVPWRWLSIEALKEMKFSTASDVWAFGVTMWEIFSLGEPPYGAWTYDLFFADRLIAGDRLLIPKHANQHIYSLMKDCWKVEPSERPTFEQIHSRLGEFCSKPL